MSQNEGKVTQHITCSPESYCQDILGNLATEWLGIWLLLTMVCVIFLYNFCSDNQDTQFTLVYHVILQLGVM